MAFNGRFILNIVHLAAKNGGDIRELISLSGKSMTELEEEGCTVDDANYNAVIEQAVKTTGDDHFGLHAGENLNLSAAGLIVQLAQTSKTVKQALELCCQYANLGCSVLPMTLIEEKDHFKVVFTPDNRWKSNSEIAFEHTTAGALAFTIKEFHSLTRMQHSPIQVNLSWPNRTKSLEYERVFGCRVNYCSPEIEILLRKEHVEDVVITSNYSLLNALIAHAEEISAKKNKEQGFAAQVTQSIINLVKPEFPTLEEVASHLNISSRTLQRKLKEENQSYKRLIDDLKMDFAIGYIKKPELSISEIAYLLNYNDASAFNRSFKRWTGKSPATYREMVTN